MPRTDRHIVYAVPFNRYAYGVPSKVRVSEPLSWGDAIDKWAALDNARRRGRKQYIVGIDDGYNYGDALVSYYVVRSADDPDWPADGERRRITTGLDGEHICVVQRAPDGRFAAGVITGSGLRVGFGPDPIRATSAARTEARHAGLI